MEESSIHLISLFIRLLNRAAVAGAGDEVVRVGPDDGGDPAAEADLRPGVDPRVLPARDVPDDDLKAAVVRRI